MPPRDLTFIAVNDLHYREAQDREWLDRVVRQMSSQPEQPELCFVLGDLVDDGTEEQLTAVRGALDRLSMPYHVVIGLDDYAAGDDRAAWETVFPGPENRLVEHAGWALLGLDTTSGTAYQETQIPRAALDWVEKTLSGLHPHQPKLVFTHFPLGEGVRYRPLNAEDLLVRLEGQNVRAVFSGHFHAATETSWKGIPLVTSRCCSRQTGNHDGSDEKGYLLCRASPQGDLQRAFVEITG